MAEEKQLQQNNLSELSKGLHRDNSFIDQPKGTYRFALNSVNETELGDSGFIGNEEANIECANFPVGYTPIGKIYIGNNQTVIFLVSNDEQVSEIGILNDNCVYVTHVNDATSVEKEKLNFSLSNQIQGTFRLRKGCERTIYFSDPKPRYYNFDKPNQFKIGGAWASSNFELRRKIKVFPTIDEVKVLDSSGNLTPGSYTILVQHMDEDFNGTEFYELVKDINVYNDASTKNFADIDGSANMGANGDPFKYSKTNKAIHIVLDAVDKSFAYVRFAFAERVSGTGNISSVKYSGPVSTSSPVFVYTGDNAETIGTVEEVELFNLDAGIHTVKHIEQIDNMLMLSNVAGEQIELNKKKKYASKVNVDCFVKDIILTTNKEEHNPKNPLASYNGIGYQSGDIYSLGLVYVFEDFTVSPVVHIPGKPSTLPNNHIFAPDANVYPMSKNNNSNISETYLEENTSCTGESYWGTDSQGVNLKDKFVRHHRFPTREEIGIGFVDRVETTGGIQRYNQIVINLLGELKKSTTDPVYVAPNFSIRVKFKRNGIAEDFIEYIYPNSNVLVTSIKSNVFLSTDILTDIKIYYIEAAETPVEEEIILTDNESELQDNGLTYNLSIANTSENNIKSTYKVPIFGLKLSNVILPPESEIGKKIIGYQVVRQERREADKNILDTAVVFPMQKSGRNVSTSMLAPEFLQYIWGPDSTCEGSEDGNYPVCYNIAKRAAMLLTPGHKFMDKTYDGFTSIEQVGNYEREYVARAATSTQNVFEGSSATGDEDSVTKDDDGFTLRHGYRFTGVKYKPTVGTPLVISNVNTRTYNLEGINYAETEDNEEVLYNLACDNKALIVSSVEPGVDMRAYRPGKYHFPYVHIKKDNSSFYQNFRSNPYYLASTDIFYTSTAKVFGGDTFVAPLRYSNHIFGNAVGAIRRSSVNIWASIGMALLAIAAIVIAPFTAGGSLVLLGGVLLAVAAVVTGAATLISADKFNEIYREKWQANLDRTTFDFFYARLFIREHPGEKQPDYNPDPDYQPWADDTLRWWGETVGDLWFETTLNISLRVPPTNMENNYPIPLKPYMGDRTSDLYLCSETQYKDNNTVGSGRFRRYNDPYMPINHSEEWYFIKKITKTDSKKPSGLDYLGISLPQIYLVNPDYYSTSGIKKFYTLPIQYDCCTNCQEKFPHRIHYSQQAFQEEKSDNYRIFLPNNYIDIEGNTGEINNMFRMGSNLYAHTEEALWQMGRNYKERVTDNVVSFIGTGSYFEIPPQKMIDDDTGSSAGTKHKWSAIKTPHGFFFVTENQRKIYQFDGKQLKDISNIGLNNWFKENIEVQTDKAYTLINDKPYPFQDNPSHPEGTGFISTYDTRKERIIFTKKDTSSWTMSFSLKNNTWTSWHTYLPSFYINVPEKFYSWKQGSRVLWKHGAIDKYQTFYNTFAPHIVELVSVSNPVTTRTWNHILLQTEARKYDATTKEYLEEKYVTYNKAIVYNSRQCSGSMDLIVKDSGLNDANYMVNEVINTNNNMSIIDRSERDWYINDFRDIRVDYTKPIWNSANATFTSPHYIDKELNTSTLNVNKDWTQLESFRDKYLVVRYIFDKFADKKLITNFSIENEQQSFR